MTSNWIVWMLSVTVLILLFKALALIRKPLRLIIAGRRVEGTVIALTENTSIIKHRFKDTCQSPTIEFYTITGNKITIAGKFNCAAPIARLGDKVKVAYHISKPTDAKMLSSCEIPFIPFAIYIGIAASIILIWVTSLLISNSSALDDPFHFFSLMISRYHLTPLTFPVLFFLALLSLGSLLYSYVLIKKVLRLQKKGTRVIGTAIGNVSSADNLNNESSINRFFAYISYPAESGINLIMRRSLIKPLTQIKKGDKIEIIYPDRQPHKSLVFVWDELYFNPAIFLLFAIGFFVLFFHVLNSNVI